MSQIVFRAIVGMSTYALVEISPATMQRPVVTSVSHATRASGSCSRIASSTESEIWSAILSGWPSVTDSEVNVQVVMLALSSQGSILRRPARLDDGVQDGVGDRSLVGQRHVALRTVGAQHGDLVREIGRAHV